MPKMERSLKQIKSFKANKNGENLIIGSLGLSMPALGIENH